MDRRDAMTQPTPVDKALLEKAHQETAAMGRAERVLHWDRRQSLQSDEAIFCGHDKRHGRLQVHGGGSLLLCTASKNGAGCTFNQPISL